MLVIKMMTDSIILQVELKDLVKIHGLRIDLDDVENFLKIKKLFLKL